MRVNKVVGIWKRNGQESNCDPWVANLTSQPLHHQSTHSRVQVEEEHGGELENPGSPEETAVKMERDYVVLRNMWVLACPCSPVV